MVRSFIGKVPVTTDAEQIAELLKRWNRNFFRVPFKVDQKPPVQYHLMLEVPENYYGINLNFCNTVNIALKYYACFR